MSAPRASRSRSTAESPGASWWSSTTSRTPGCTRTPRPSTERRSTSCCASVPSARHRWVGSPNTSPTTNQRTRRPSRRAAPWLLVWAAGQLKQQSPAAPLVSAETGANRHRRGAASRGCRVVDLGAGGSVGLSAHFVCGGEHRGGCVRVAACGTDEWLTRSCGVWSGWRGDGQISGGCLNRLESHGRDWDRRGKA